LFAVTGGNPRFSFDEFGLARVSKTLVQAAKTDRSVHENW
jgi:hypothetical protein